MTFEEWWDELSENKRSMLTPYPIAKMAWDDACKQYTELLSAAPDLVKANPYDRRDVRFPSKAEKAYN